MDPDVNEEADMDHMDTSVLGALMHHVHGGVIAPDTPSWRWQQLTLRLLQTPISNEAESPER